MPRFVSIPALVVALLLAAAPVAAGEEGEMRISAAGQGGLLSMNAFGSSSEVYAFGGRASVGHGLSRSIDLGLDVSYLTQSAASFAEPMVDGVFGSDLVAYADVHATEFAASLRYMLQRGPGMFARLHPTLQVRGGLAARWLTSAAVYTDSGSEVQSLKSDRSLRPFVGVAAGAVWRTGDHLQLGLLATSTFAANHRALGLAFELSWQRDTLF